MIAINHVLIKQTKANLNQCIINYSKNMNHNQRYYNENKTLLLTGQKPLSNLEFHILLRKYWSILPKFQPSVTPFEKKKFTK
jgi:hypothetical protein